MRYLFMILGTALGLLFIVHLSRGEKYEPMLEVLDGSEFPLKSLYGEGLSISNGILLKLKGRREAQLRMQASLLYEPQYAEYYANIIWAQAVTLTHLLLTMTFLLSAIMYGTVVVILGGGLFLSVLMAVYCLDNMKNVLAERTQECEMELPEVVSTMAILVNSGMVLREAWNVIANSGEGVFYDLMKKASINMQNGYSDSDAIYLFGKESNSVEIKKFTSMLLQSMSKGGGELSIFLAMQSSELWNLKRQRMLQSGEKAATKLLMPIMLIFVGILIIVMTAAFAGSLF